VGEGDGTVFVFLICFFFLQPIPAQAAGERPPLLSLLPLRRSNAAGGSADAARSDLAERDPVARSDHFVHTTSAHPSPLLVPADPVQVEFAFEVTLVDDLSIDPSPIAGSLARSERSPRIQRSDLGVSLETPVARVPRFGGRCARSARPREERLHLGLDPARSQCPRGPRFSGSRPPVPTRRGRLRERVSGTQCGTRPVRGSARHPSTGLPPGARGGAPNGGSPCSRRRRSAWKSSRGSARGSAGQAAPYT